MSLLWHRNWCPSEDDQPVKKARNTRLAEEALQADIAELVGALDSLLRPYGPVDTGLHHAPANELKAFMLAASSARAILSKHEARDA